MNRGNEVEGSRVKSIRDKGRVLKCLLHDRIETEYDDPKDHLKSKVKDIFYNNLRVKTERSVSKEREKRSLLWSLITNILFC